MTQSRPPITGLDESPKEQQDAVYISKENGRQTLHNAEHMDGRRLL